MTQYPNPYPQPQPQYPGYPPQQYPPQAPPVQYPPQQYGQVPTAPVQPLAQGSLSDYYGQPSGNSGPALKFTDTNNQPLIGCSYVVQVARAVTNSDVTQQTNRAGTPQTYKDGRPKFVMVVPVLVLEPNGLYPEGRAGWWVKGATRDELSRAMSEAGAPEGPPEAGAIIRVTLTGTRPSGPGMNPAHVFSVQYTRPQGAPQEAVTTPLPAVQPQPGTHTQPSIQQAVTEQTLDPAQAELLARIMAAQQK